MMMTLFLTRCLKNYISYKYIERNKTNWKNNMSKNLFGYKCKKCGKKFENKTQYTRHLKRKTPCDPIIEANLKNPLTCRYCGRTYVNKNNLKRHVSISCKVYKNHDILADHLKKKEEAKLMRRRERRVENEKFKQQEAEIKDLRYQLLELKGMVTNNRGNSNSNYGNVNNISVINNDNSVNDNRTYNINVRPQVVAFNYTAMTDLITRILEDKSNTSDFESDIKSLMLQNKPDRIIKEVMRNFHDNPNIPEGQNILCRTSGPHRGKIISFQEDGWVLTERKYFAELIKGEICHIISRLTREGKYKNHKKTQKCINTLNSEEFAEENSINMVDEVVHFKEIDEKSVPDPKNKKQITYDNISEESESTEEISSELSEELSDTSEESSDEYGFGIGSLVKRAHKQKHLIRY